MPQIITAGMLNTQALTTDDAYVQIVAPPSFITGAPTDVVGLVGTASYGPVNVPVHLGSGQDAGNAFGPMSAASLSDPHDLATALYLAFGQAASQATLEAFAVRVTDGTDTSASAAITGVASPSAETLTIGGTVAAGDTVTATVTSTALAGSPVSVAYDTLSTDTTTTIAAALVAAINANAAMAAAGITAQSAAAVISIYAPASVTYTVAGSSTGTITVTSGSGTPTTTGALLSSLSTGVLANQIRIQVSIGSAANSFTVTILPPVGLPEVYPNIPGATFWATLANAINYGQSTIRGRSAVVKVTLATPAVGVPSTGSFTLSGGTDGRSGVTTATLLGNADATPATGLFALTKTQPAAGIVLVAGCTDLAAAPTILAFNQSAGTSAVVPLATGLSTTAAIAAVQGAGASDASMLYCKDFVSFFDPINNSTRRVPASAVIAGKWATLGPQQSPGNKPVNLVVGTERNDPILGNIAYSSSEIGQLETAGITLITNPIPRGAVFGIRHGQTSSPNPVTAPAEYWRMTMYLARSAAGFLGQYVDEEQSQSANDPVRQSLALQSNRFLKGLEGASQIDRFLVTCKFSASPSATPGNGMNTPASVASHYLFCLWQVTYLSSVRFLILSLQGGTTVVEVAGTLQPQPNT